MWTTKLHRFFLSLINNNLGAINNYILLLFKGLNKTTFSIESDDWIDVPVCQQDALHWIQDYYWVIIIIAAIAIAVLGAVTAIFVWRKKNCYYGYVPYNTIMHLHH